MDDLVKLAKANPGGLNYGTAGPGTFPHLSVLMLEHLAGIKLQPVHYRGAAPALNDVVAGHINLIVMGPSVAIPSFESGAVRFLGIGSEKPLPQLKGVKPVADTVPGYAAYAGFGIAAPAKTPMQIVQKINADIQEILADPEFRAKILDPQLLTPITGNQEQFAAKLKAETEKWQDIIADSKLVLSAP
jgi:tripartite-type tricarboxylate transporter receptor subunit TctC